MSSFSAEFLAAVTAVAQHLPRERLELMADGLAEVRARHGRLFCLGVGGSAGNSSHAVNDFRKICGIEAYAPTDNVSELTARTNDDGWERVFEGWLAVSRLKRTDALFVLSVGGGDLARGISVNLVRAVDYAREVGCPVFGVVGKDGGHVAKCSDAVVIVPTVDPRWITPLTEAYQSVVCHLLVSHPKLKAHETKWEQAAKT